MWDVKEVMLALKKNAVETSILTMWDVKKGLHKSRDFYTLLPY